MMLYLSLGLATSAASVALAAGNASFITYNGTINGAQCTSSQANYFFGIPYGKDPARFAAPQIFDSKYGENGTLDATQPAPSCMQFGSVFVENGTQSEDW
jgi:carboxylesterase type B